MMLAWLLWLACIAAALAAVVSLRGADGETGRILVTEPEHSGARRASKEPGRPALPARPHIRRRLYRLLLHDHARRAGFGEA